MHETAVTPAHWSQTSKQMHAKAKSERSGWIPKVLNIPMNFQWRLSEDIF
jgi:hypothetical protein